MIKLNKILTATCLSSGMIAHAQTIDIKEPNSFETPLDVPQETLLKTTNEPQAPISTAYTEAEAANGIEEAINQAIRSQNWQQLDELLNIYIKQNSYDELLYHYGLGALRRSQMRHDEAIASYQKLVDAEPDLYYPRFDLGVMLFENKQYNQAWQEITTAKDHLDPRMQQLAEVYLQQIKKEQRWQPDISLNYEANSNVNNAADSDVIIWQGREWKKSEDSLPQKATGIRYDVGVFRDLNIGGNHFISTDIGVDGVHYWDNKQYNEQSIRLKAGYGYKDIKTTASVMPFIEQNWLGGNKYSRVAGVNLYASERLNQQLRVSGGIGFSKKEYEDEATARQYDGNTFSTNGTVSYSLSPKWLVFGSLNFNRDNTESAEKASKRYGVGLGTVKIFDNGLGSRLNLNYAQRNFDAPGTLVYQFKRKDDEYRVQSEFWHKKISYKGLTPHMNFNYSKIDSNMPDFYSRDGFQWFISINKDF